MVLEYQTLYLDFVRTNYKFITAKQYDNQSRHIKIYCQNNGILYPIPKGTIVNVKINTPDNRAVLDKLSIEDDGSIILILNDNMLAYPGKANAELTFIDSKKRLTTMSFGIVIEPSVYSDDTIVASDEFNVLTELYEKAEKDYQYVITECQLYEASALQHANTAITEAKHSENYSDLSFKYSMDCGRAATSALQSADKAENSKIAAQASETKSASHLSDCEAAADYAEQKAELAKQNATLAKKYADDAYKATPPGYEAFFNSTTSFISGLGLLKNQYTSHEVVNNNKVYIKDDFLSLGLTKDLGVALLVMQTGDTHDNVASAYIVYFNTNTNVCFATPIVEGSGTRAPRFYSNTWEISLNGDLNSRYVHTGLLLLFEFKR